MVQTATLLMQGCHTCVRVGFGATHLKIWYHWDKVADPCQEMWYVL